MGMKATPKGIEETLLLLAETPQRIAAATGNLSDERLHMRPAKGSWSANDILAHLRACADVWGETIQAMLSENEPSLRHISPRTWLKATAGTAINAGSRCSAVHWTAGLDSSDPASIGSGTKYSASRAKRPAKGRKNRVLAMLKMV